MTATEAGLLAQLVLAAFAVVAVVAVTPARRAVVGGVTCAMVSVAGIFTGAVAMSGRTGSLEISMALPLDPVTLAPDRLGGVFILVASAVGVLVSVYGISYVSGPAASRTSWAAMAVFLVGMQVVPAAADVVSFLLAWEVMALASTALLLADQTRRPQVRPAALWYAVMTQLSFLLLIAGFAVLAGASGGTEFADLATVGSGSGVAGLAFVLLILGFGCKAGLVPLHVWLPRAHPEAPSHVSAAMSAAMVKMGVYGALLVCVRLLPAGPTWWGVLLAALGAASAMDGILQASVASDVKRLLAYSTTENVGLMILALGVSVLMRAHGVVAGADAALTACLLLVVSHAAFKATLFLGAGSVQHATQERDLDRLGGLGARMPWTAAAFGVASLGAAALPVTVGFAAEWTLLQSLVHGARPQDPLVAVVMPAGVAVVALTAGLALLTFVKAYGIGFLARPRSEQAAGAHEAPVPMQVAMVAGAAAVVLLGLVPGPLASGLAATVGARGVSSAGLAGLNLSSINALLHPVALMVLAAAVAIPVVVIAVAAARAHPRRTTGLLWGCGGARVSPRMQYTATSYAEPLIRVFDDVLQPARDVEVTHAVESRYLVQRVQYRQRVAGVIEMGMYRPVIALAGRVGVGARRLQNGRIHHYLAFSFFALLAVVLVASL